MNRRVGLGLVLIVVIGIVASSFVLLRPAASVSNQPTPSAYIAQQDSPVRGLSAQEVDDLRNGRGAGYARMAELNSYPGPRHVLDLGQQLGLSTEQQQQVQAAFQQMSAAAKPLGTQIVEREQQLSSAFASGQISEAMLAAQTSELGTLYGLYRDIHLKAHIQITPLLTADQIARYNQLRGYSDTPAPTAANGTGSQATPAEHHHMQP